MPRNVLIEFRRDTAANWTSADPTLAAGEPGFETDTGLFKIGDGTTAWTSLPYASGSVPSLADVLAVGNYVGSADPAFTGDPAASGYAGGFIQLYARFGGIGGAANVNGGSGDVAGTGGDALLFGGDFSGSTAAPAGVIAKGTQSGDVAGRLQLVSDGSLGAPGDVLASDGTYATWRTNLSPHEVVLDGGGSTIATGVKLDLRLLYDAEIRGVSLLADQSGDLELDLWKCSYADFDDSTHPVIGDSIVASAPPTITASVKSEDTTLTGWDTTIDAGDVLRVVVASATSITRATLVLHLARV